MRAIDDFLPEVLPFAPNCPEPLVTRYVIEAARDLCRSARVWREIKNLAMVLTSSYESISTTVDSDIVDIEQAEMLDSATARHALTPVTLYWLDGYHPGWRDETTAGSARYVVQVNTDSVSIFPRQKGTLRLHLVLQPSLRAVLLPDWIYDNHRTLIGRAAAAKAMLTPSEWSNPQLGAAMLSDAKSQIASIKTQSIKGQQGARLHTRGIWF